MKFLLMALDEMEAERVDECCVPDFSTVHTIRRRLTLAVSAAGHTSWSAFH
jgi:hypothetical protein